MLPKSVASPNKSMVRSLTLHMAFFHPLCDGGSERRGHVLGEILPVNHVVIFGRVEQWHLKSANFVADTCDIAFMI